MRNNHDKIDYLLMIDMHPYNTIRFFFPDLFGRLPYPFLIKTGAQGGSTRKDSASV